MEPGLAKAQETMDYINSNPEEMELYEKRELVRIDIENAKKRDIQEGIEIGEEKGIKKGIKKGIEIGEEKGINEGIKKGKKEEKLEIAIKLKNKGIPLEIITETTGLPLSKVKKL